MNCMILAQAQIKRLLYLALYAVYERYQLVLLPFIIVPIIVIGLSATAEKQYTNHASILIEESALLNPYLDELSFSFELSERIDALRTLVLSRNNLAEIVEEMQLVPEGAPIREVEQMRQKLGQAISISVVGDELVKISFKWNNQAQMKPILELVVEKFIERLLAPTKSSLDTSEQFFLDQLELMRSELEKSEDQLAQFKADNRDALPELMSVNQETMSRLEQQKQMKTVVLSGAQAKFNTLAKKMSKANPILGHIEDKILRTEAEIALLRTRYTDKHSKLQAKLKELENLKAHKQTISEKHQSIDSTDLDSLWQIANTLPQDGEKQNNALLVSQLLTLEEAKNSLAQHQQELDMLDEQIRLIAARLSSTTDIDKKLRKLQRDLEVKQNLYKDMLERYEMSKVTGQLVRYEGPDKVKTIERAYSPSVPINNPLWISVVLGIVLGLFCGIALVFVYALLDTRIKDMKTVAHLTEQPVLTVMPIVHQEFEREIIIEASRSSYE
ncbi:GumC family protein [Pseudoalteromonas sp. SS15]